MGSLKATGGSTSNEVIVSVLSQEKGIKAKSSISDFPSLCPDILAFCVG